jgi:hypothetical protein
MRKILNAYGFPTIQLIGFVGITICSLWFGSWYSQGEKDYVSSFNASQKNVSTHIKSATFWDVTLGNKTEFGKPVPYTVLSILIGVFGGLGSFRGQWKVNSYNQLESNYRDEKSAHGETQQNYHRAIGYIIQSIFVTTNKSFNNDARITIYRHTNDGFLKRIYRHAPQSRYEHGGRVSIPDNEGVVGAAWQNEGIAHLTLTHGFKTQAYIQQMEKYVREHGAIPVSCNTNMPTKEYFTMAIRATDRTKMAVIVLESTSTGAFSREALEPLISQENQDIAQYIIHKSKLDEIFNPDGGSDNA